MKTKLEKEEIEKLKNASVIITDLSDNLVKNKVSYSAFYLISEKFKKREYSNAIRLIINGIKIYFLSHLKRAFENEWEVENQALKDLYKCFSKNNIKKEENEKIAKKYIIKNEIPGAKNFLKKIRKIGKNKKIVLITREPSEYADVAKNYFGVDDYICNITECNENKIKNVKIVIEKPEDKLKLLEEKIKENELKDSIVITNNPEDYSLFKDKVGLLISSPRSKKELKENSNLHISDYEKFERDLINSCYESK